MDSDTLVETTVQVSQKDLYKACQMLNLAGEHVREALTKHDASLGRTTLSNRRAAEAMEKDITDINMALQALLSAIDIPYNPDWSA